MITMVIDDRLKGVIQERLNSGNYPNFGALYRALRTEGSYSSSQTYFMIEVRFAELDIPPGFGKKKKARATNGVSSIDREDNEVEKLDLEKRIRGTGATQGGVIKCKRVALERARDLKMGYTDIGYFLEVSSYEVHKNTRRLGKMRSKRFEVGRVGKRKSLQHFYYKHASQVYEKIDACLCPNDIQRSLDITLEGYTFLVENRTIVEPRIVHALRTMYNHPTHNVPYVTAELREHLQTTNN